LPPSLRFVLIDMLHDRSRTTLSVIGLAVVIGSYFLLVSLSAALASSLDTSTISRNLIVIQNDSIDPSDAVLEPQVVQAAQQLIPDLVSRISPIVFRHTRVGGQVVQLRAAALDDWQPIYHLTLLQGTWPVHDREVIVGEGLALSNNWQVGSSVQIFGSDFTISGICRAPGIAFASVWMPIGTFWTLFDTNHNYQALFVQAAVGVDAETLRVKLQNDPHLASSYAVYFEDNYSRHNIQALQDMSSLMSLASGVALLGIVFGVFNATTLSSAERSRELGILLSVGFSHARVRGLLWLRSILQALLAFGLGLIAALVYLKTQQATAPLVILGVPFNLGITPWTGLSGLGWVIGLAFVGAWLSTRRMFNLRVVELLR
jgi:ABC-type antimicrobial peptide transport system permease subunit